MKNLYFQIMAVGITVLVLTTTAIQLSSWWLTSRHNHAQVLGLIEQANNYLADLLSSREKSLISSAQVLTADYGFRQAISTKDVATINSMLINHVARINANLLVVLDFDGNLIATNETGFEQGNIQQLFNELRQEPHKAKFAFINNTFYRIFLLPVMAPKKIAYTIIGEQVSLAILTRLKRTTGLDITLLSDKEQHYITTTELDYNALEKDVMSSSSDWTLFNRPEQIMQKLKVETFDSSPISFYVHIDLSSFYKDFDKLSSTLHKIVLFFVIVGFGLCSILSRCLTEPIARLHKKLIYRATHDRLTGIPNRFSAIERIKHAIQLAKRQQQSICICVCDIDFFKRINDQHGHSAGDKVLRLFSTTLTKQLRQTDILGRYGGEEFIIAVQMNAEEGKVLFERLRAGLAASKFAHNGVETQITMSFGVCVYEPSQQNVDLETIIDLADKALYEAKSTGRNKVIFCNAEMTEPALLVGADAPNP